MQCERIDGYSVTTKALTFSKSHQWQLEDLYSPLKQERILWDSITGIFYRELWLLSRFLFPVGSIGFANCFYFEVGKFLLLCISML